MAASLSSCGNTWWKDEFLLKLTMKSSNWSCFFVRGPATLHFFLYWVVQLLSGDFSFGISLFIDGSEDTIPPLAAAVAAAMARLAFLCRIPQALQRDLGPLGPLLHKGVLVVLQSEHTLITVFVELFWSIGHSLVSLLLTVRSEFIIFLIILIFDDIHLMGALSHGSLCTSSLLTIDDGLMQMLL